MSDTLEYLEKAARHLCVTKLCPAFDSGVVKLPPVQNFGQGDFGSPSWFRCVLTSTLQYMDVSVGALAVYDYFLILDDEVCQLYPPSGVQRYLSWRKISYVWRGKKSWSGYTRPMIFSPFTDSARCLY